jgi:two-component system phosphate regulon response regulator PhoB
MRSLTFRYPDRDALSRDLEREDPELPLPPGQRGEDGEWVLAVFKVDDGTNTASAARLEDREGGLALVFEPRDWERLAAEVKAPGAPSTPRMPAMGRPPPKKGGGPRSKAKGAGARPSVAPSSKKSGSNAPRSVRPRQRTGRSMPPPSRSGTVLTRTLVPPPQAEIHEADAPDHTLEAPIGTGGSFSIPAKRPPRLLLVDDDRDMQVMIREMLEAIDLRLECASDGEEALDRLTLEPFDLVVLDWNLPGMSGLDLCRELRRHPRLADIPILFLTAKSGQRDLVDAFAAGADDFLGKPFRAPELGARLLALLRRAKVALSMAPPG